MTSLGHVTAQCVLDCDVDNRRDLLQALVYTGGTSLLPGFADRIARQLQDVRHGLAPVMMNGHDDNF